MACVKIITNANKVDENCKSQTIPKTRKSHRNGLQKAFYWCQREPSTKGSKGYIDSDIEESINDFVFLFHRIFDYN
jgi:hypothetical protein